jgi:hypothetical protein
VDQLILAVDGLNLMHHHEIVFVLIFTLLLFVSCICLIWLNFRPRVGSKGQFLAANLGYGLVAAGSGLRILNDTVWDSAMAYHKLIGSLSLALVGIALGIFVCLMITWKSDDR